MSSPGSSPRMRGTQPGATRQVAQGRIIPADAGNTNADGMALNPKRDHPRGCGEHSAPTVFAQSAIGSSPRMRGTLFELVVEALALGIIPADAGNTCPAPPRCRRIRDHPRGCGEHQTL